MTPKYDPVSNAYSDSGDAVYSNERKMQPNLSDEFAVFALKRVSASNIEVILVEEGYSHPGARTLARNYGTTRADGLVYIAASSVTGILYGFDPVQFMQDFPPPSGGHTPIIINLGNNQFSLTYREPEPLIRVPSDPNDGLTNQNLEQPLGV